MASSKPDLRTRTLDRLRALGVTSEDALLVAVSGGMDSMSLLNVLCMLRDDSEVGSLAAVHVNHLLRGEASESDERLVRRQCDIRIVPLVVHRIDALAYGRDKKIGLEEAARECRYEVFQGCAQSLGIAWVLTAHTANDQAETILMNIVRGAGLRGIGGIPAVRRCGDVAVLRPWLAVTREQIEQYQLEANVTYSDDATNAELTFQRNRVRHIVVPALQQAFPDRDVLHAFASLGLRATAMSQTIRWIAEQELQKARDGGPGLDLNVLRRIPTDLASETIELWLEESIGRHRLSSEDRRRVEEFILQDSGSRQLSGVTLISRERRLRIAEKPASFEGRALAVGDVITLHQGQLRVNPADVLHKGAGHLYVPAESLGVLLLRPWQDQDRMRPFGMAGRSKLISDLLTEAAIADPWRKNYPVIQDAVTGEVLWVPGVRGAEVTRLKPSQQPDGLIELSWSPNREQ